MQVALIAWPGLAQVILLGLLAAVNPCQIAIALAALAGRAESLPAVGLYGSGRFAAHVLLAWILLFVLAGSDQAATALCGWFAAVEWLVPWVMVAVALCFLWRSLFPCRHHKDCHDSGRIIRRVGPRGMFLLGMALALAFCPESAVFYFGLMLPLSVSESQPFLFPLAYALASAVPSLLIGYACWRAMHIGRNHRQGGGSGRQDVQHRLSGERLLYALLALLSLAMAIYLWMN